MQLSGSVALLYPSVSQHYGLHDVATRRRNLRLEREIHYQANLRCVPCAPMREFYLFEHSLCTHNVFKTIGAARWSV